MIHGTGRQYDKKFIDKKSRDSIRRVLAWKSRPSVQEALPGAAANGFAPSASGVCELGIARVIRIASASGVIDKKSD